MKLFKGYYGCALILFFLMEVSISAALAAPFQIYVKGQVEVDGDEIRLGDIARIKDAKWDEMRKLGDIVVGTSPSPGNLRHLKRDDVIIRLKQSEVDLSRLELVMPPKVAIRRSFIRLSAKEIEKAVLSAIEKGKLGSLGSAEIKRIQINHGVTLPKGKVSYHFAAPREVDWQKPLHLSVVLYVDGKAAKKVSVFVKAEMLADIVVATKPLRRHHIIGPDDIALKRMDIATLPADVILAFSEVVGKRTRRTINSHTVLRQDLIDLPPLVHRNDLVVIVAESTGLRITALGKARQRGRMGEVITVSNIDSGKRIYARIVDSKTVTIDF